MAKGHTKAKYYEAALNYAIWCGKTQYSVNISHMKKRCMADNEIAERKGFAATIIDGIDYLDLCGFHYNQALIANISHN